MAPHHHKSKGVTEEVYIRDGQKERQECSPEEHERQQRPAEKQHEEEIGGSAPERRFFQQLAVPSEEKHVK